MALTVTRFASTFGSSSALARLMLGNSYLQQDFRALSLWRAGHFHASFFCSVASGEPRRPFLPKLRMVVEQIITSFRDGTMEKELSTSQLELTRQRLSMLVPSFIQKLFWVHMLILDQELLLDLLLLLAIQQRYGDLCVIHNGVCIGQDGFGFLVDEHGTMIKKPQLLYARIGNNVEIGANTCIDRGSWRDTIIGDHSKIDNLVQIGHNVVIGKNCLLCGQVGIAGSATIGDYVTMGGRVAVLDHVSIVSKVRLAATSCVTKDIVKPGDYGGFPAVPIQEWRRQVAMQSRISKKQNP